MFNALIAKFDQWFIPEWRKAYKLFSFWFVTGTGLLLELVQLTPILPDQIQAMIPQPYGQIATGIWTIIGLFSRLKNQGGSNA